MDGIPKKHIPPRLQKAHEEFAALVKAHERKTSTLADSIDEWLDMGYTVTLYKNSAGHIIPSVNELVGGG